MKRLFFIFLLSSFIFSCTPATSTPQVVDVYATTSASPWLEELFTCAANLSVVLNVSADSPDIFLRLGQPADLVTPAFQIDTEDILIVANRQSPLGNLTLAQARDLFAGQGDPSIQVWLYASYEDAQEVFDAAVMDGRRHSSFARLAFWPGHMSEELTADVNAIGVLPRRWLTGELRELYIAARVPVLAVTASEPEDSVRELIACLQK